MKCFRKYRVAGHLFEIGMDGDSSVWKRMENSYGPFEVGESFKENIFTFEVVQSEDPFSQEKEFVFSNAGSVEPGFVIFTIYRICRGFYVELKQPQSTETNGFLEIDRNLGRAKIVLAGNEQQRWLTLNVGVNFCYMLFALPKSTLLVHASSVIADGKGYLFLGKSGTGKSTHSRMWLSSFDDVELLNDDHPVIRVYESGEVMVYGSPWSGKTPCYKDKSVCVAAVVRISRAPYNRARRLSTIEAYASLLPSLACIPWDKELSDAIDRTMQSVIKSVGSWIMQALPDKNAAEVCRDAVAEKCSSRKTP